MHHKIQPFILIIMIATLSSCEFINNTFQYKETTKEFTEALINEDYDKCIDLFAMEHEMAQNLNVDTLKAGLVNFRITIIENFGEELEYSLMNSEKTFQQSKEIVLLQIQQEYKFNIIIKKNLEYLKFCLMIHLKRF